MVSSEASLGNTTDNSAIRTQQGFQRIRKGQEKTDQEIVDDTDNVAEMLFKLDIELWNAVRSQGKQGELLIAVVEDQTLKKPMELVRQCLIDQGVLGSP